MRVEDEFAQFPLKNLLCLAYHVITKKEKRETVQISH